MVKVFSIKIKVKTAKGLVDAEVTSRRTLAGRLCLLVEFSPANAQWMDWDDEHLVLTDEQVKEISHLHWWDRKPA